MASVRQNVQESPGALNAYVQGVLALKNEFLGTTTADIGIPGTPQPVSTYDLFTVWHHLAMGRRTPATHGSRNAAHSGPAFLPWHRLMLLLLELQMRRVLQDEDFGLPYWDWAADGDLPPGQQANTPLWQPGGIGGGIGAPGNPNPVTVTDGPFRPAQFRVRIVSDGLVRLRAVDRGLTRRLGGDSDAPTLPTSADVTAALQRPDYDVAPWEMFDGSFRDVLEGWPGQPGLHNRVHVWVGGDMGPASSPNDPVFYLNHCNVDRVWEAWMRDHGRVYAPPQSVSAALNMHRLNDAMYSILIQQPVTPADMLDAGFYYSYDKLP